MCPCSYPAKFLVILLPLLTILLAWSCSDTAAGLVSNKRLRENGVKEFTVEKEIRGNDCACNCRCASILSSSSLSPNNGFAQYTPSLPAPPGADQLTLHPLFDTSAIKYFKIVKEISKNRCSCSCSCLPRGSSTISTIRPVGSISANAVQTTVVPEIPASTGMYTLKRVHSPSQPSWTPSTISPPAERLPSSTASPPTGTNGAAVSSRVTSPLPSGSVEPVDGKVHSASPATLPHSPTTPSYTPSTPSPQNQFVSPITSSSARTLPTTIPEVGLEIDPQNSASLGVAPARSGDSAATTVGSTGAPPTSAIDSIYKAKAANLLNMLKQKLNRWVEKQRTMKQPPQLIHAAASTSSPTDSPSSGTARSLATDTQPAAGGQTNSSRRAELLLHTLKSKLEELKRHQAELANVASGMHNATANNAQGGRISNQAASTPASSKDPASFSSTISSTREISTITTTGSPTTMPSAGLLIDRMLESYRAGKEQKPNGEMPLSTSPAATEEEGANKVKSISASPIDPSTAERMPAGASVPQEEKRKESVASYVTDAPELKQSTRLQAKDGSAEPVLIKVGPPKRVGAPSESSIATNVISSNVDAIAEHMASNGKWPESVAKTEDKETPIQIRLPSPPKVPTANKIEQSPASKSSNNATSNILEQARKLREERRHLLEMENSVLGEAAIPSNANLQRRRQLIEEKLAQLAQLERWHRELLQNRQLHQQATTPAAVVQTSPTTSHTKRGEIVPSQVASQPAECELVRKFVNAFQIDASGKWVEENCAKIRGKFPAASCAYIQDLIMHCYKFW